MSIEKKRRTVCFLRRSNCGNHPADLEIAVEAAKSGPTWVFLLGPDRERRSKEAKQALGFPRDGVSLHDQSHGGVTVYAPLKLSKGNTSRESAAPSATDLAGYLMDQGLHFPRRQRGPFQIWLDKDFDPLLLAAVVEAASCFREASLHIDDGAGGGPLSFGERWGTKRGLFSRPQPQAGGSPLIGESDAICAVKEKIERYARELSPVLIIGETGTGKELVASELHRLSGAAGQFLPTNAALLSPELAESLLFGHTKGAFTGADSERSGRIKEAAGGTFFLDEVFNLDPLVQGKLLRALNHADRGTIKFEPLGSTRPTSVQTRLIVASQGDPRTTGDPGLSSMRLDLYYRVAALEIRLPRLEERLEDIPSLLSHRLKELQRDQVTLASDAASGLGGYSWPGNVRELNLVLQRALVESGPADSEAFELTSEHLARALGTVRLDREPRPLALGGSPSLDLQLLRIEVATLRAASQRHPENHSAAGRLVGMKSPNNFKQTLDNKEKKLKELEGCHAR